MSVLVELAVFNLASVAIAADCNVPRIELCSDYAVGGVTPAFPDFIEARKLFRGKIFVMIRPRSGNFVYSDEEFELMLIEMEKFKAAGADGFVSGFLNENATVNILQTRAFVNACAPLPVTFHRAIDECVDYNAAVANVVDCGVKRILSTGTAPSAFLGKQMLNEVQKKYSDQLIVVAGGSVRSAGLSDFLNNSVISEVHSAAIMKAGSDVVNAEELNELIRLANVF